MINFSNAVNQADQDWQLILFHSDDIKPTGAIASANNWTPSAWVYQLVDFDELLS